MHLYNEQGERVDLILHEQMYVHLYYKQYPGVQLLKRELQRYKDIYIDIESETVEYRPNGKESVIVLCTPDSYTDSEPSGTLTLLYFNITPEVRRALLTP